MSWTRVRCSGFKTINLPPQCPNCLAAVPNHNWALAEYRIQWNSCPKCYALVAARKKISLLAGVVPGVVVFAACLCAALFFGAPEWVFLSGLLAAMLLLPVGFAIGGIVILLKPLEDGRVSNFEPIRVHRCGKKAFSDELFFDLEFKNPEYVKQLVELNPGLEIKVG
jgi:hypothetical protein